MAIIRNGVNGTVSGKAGSVVFVQTKNGNYVRSLPRLKKGRKPTPAQLENRKRFKLVRDTLSYILPIIRRGFAQCNPPKTAYSCAMSYNLKNAVLKTDNSYTIDWEKFMVAKGMPNPLTSSHAEIDTATQKLRLAWEYDPQVEAMYDMRYFDSYVVLYPARDIGYTPWSEGGRHSLGEGKLEMTLPSHENPMMYHIYLFFFASDATNRSTDSVHLGTIEW